MLPVIQHREKPLHTVTSADLHFGNQAAAVVAEPDQYHSAIGVVVPALDERSLSHAVHDARGIRQCHVELISQVTHWHLTVLFKEREQVEAEDRDPVCVAAQSPPLSLMGQQRGEGLDDLGRVVQGSSSGGRRGHAIIMASITIASTRML